MIDSRLECLLLGVAPNSPSSPSMHLRLTGPRGEGRRVIGDKDRLEVQPRLVGEEEGEGEKERLGTGICMEGEKHCFPVVPAPADPDLVGEGEGDGEVRGEGNGPTPMVSGVIIWSVLRDTWLLLVCPVSLLLSLKLKSSQLWLRLFSIHRPL